MRQSILMVLISWRVQKNCHLKERTILMSCHCLGICLKSHVRTEDAAGQADAPRSEYSHLYFNRSFQPDRQMSVEVHTHNVHIVSFLCFTQMLVS